MKPKCLQRSVFMTLAMAAVAGTCVAQQPGHYEISGLSPLISGREILLFQVGHMMRPLDSAQVDAGGRFQLRGKVPVADIYLLRIKGENQLDPVPLSNQARLTAEFGKATSGMSQYSLKLSGSVETALWQQVWQPRYQKLMGSSVPADSQLLREFSALLRAHASSYLAPYLAYYYLREQASARPLLDSLLTRFTREQPASPYLPRLRELSHPSYSLEVGTLAPDLALPDAAGHTVVLSSLRGRYVLVDFWASWCGPCRQENPHQLAAYQKFRTVAPGFTVYSISLDDDRTKWTRAVAQDGLPWTQVSDLLGGEGPAVQLYQAQSIPTTYLLDPSGRIVAKNLRGEELSKELEKLLH